MSGWISLHRKLIDNPIYSNAGMLKLWVHCLLKASHAEHDLLVGNQVIKLQPGQFVTGRNALASEFNKGAKKEDMVSPITLWRWLNLFEKLEMLNIKKTTKYSVVTVINWSMYQPNEQQMNNKRTTNEQQMNTNNNGNKGNNDNKNNYYVEIIDYLNQHAETNFKSSTKKTKELINARLAEGFTLEDFKTVIEYCCKEWKGKVFGNGELGDSYLRPSTLFNNKFDERLNKAKLGSTQTPQQEQTSNYKPIKIDMTRGED